jgi:hypothetical protein
MDDTRPGGTNIHGTITDNSGNAAVGTDIQQSQTRIDLGSAPTPEELQQLTTAFTDLKAQVAREAPPELREEAVRKTEELEQATTAPEPDVSAMARARRWFLENVPTLFGAVTTVVVNPIVGKIVHAAGEAIAKEYERRFPEAAGEGG